jgi:potassium/hydrogen antiporter
LEFFDKFIFFSGLILIISVLAGTLSKRGSVPILLIFLGIGMMFGEDGPGNIVFENIGLSYLVCSIALAVILFDGGMNTSMRLFRIGIRPALSLATLGVMMTALILAVILWAIFGIAFLPALLIGTTVASTDAAAVFMLLHQQHIKLRKRLVAALETESGLNDPMAVFLTIGVVHLVIATPGQDAASLMSFFAQQMLIGAFVGVAGGYILAQAMNRFSISIGLEPIFAIAGALTIFGGAAVLHGSGFMAVYIAGLVLGHFLKILKTEVSTFLDSMAWLAQIVMLLLLGLLVTPSKMLGDLPLALVAAFVLIFIARPLAVFASLYFSRFTRQEKLFVSWVGLRGAVPIYLALIPALMGVEGAGVYFNVAFAIVLFSLIVQGWTIRPVAKYLGLQRG